MEGLMGNSKELAPGKICKLVVHLPHAAWTMHMPCSWVLAHWCESLCGCMHVLYS